MVRLQPPFETRSNTVSARCQLLVSVRNSDEARICLDAGVDWIDLKEPSAGSLGMPSRDVAERVADVLRDYPQRSVALGELIELDDLTSARRLSELFPIVKVGLSKMQGDRNWQEKLTRFAQSLAATLVPVVYADWTMCEAPRPLEVVEWAMENRSPYLLIDTFLKDGKRLLHHVEIDRLSTLIRLARSADVRVVLAGSLSDTDVPLLLSLPCTALAVRGAVCSQSRQSDIDAEKVKTWVKTLLAGC